MRTARLSPGCLKFSSFRHRISVVIETWVKSLAVATPNAGGSGANVMNSHENKPDPGPKPPREVSIVINGQTFEVQPGSHPVAQLKTIPQPNIPKEDTLCQMIGGVLTPLDNKAHVTIVGGEVFASNCPSGGAS